MTDEGFDYVEGMRHQLTTSGSADEPHMVFTDDRFAIAFSDRTRFAQRGVSVIYVDETGDPGDSTPVEIDPDAQEPRLAWTGEVLGLTYFDPDNVSCGSCCTRVERRVRFTTLDLAGTTLSAIVELESNASNSPNPRVTWSGSEFGIAYIDNDVYLHHADAAGTVLDGRVSVDSNNVEGFDMVHDGTSYAFLFADNRDLLFNIGTPGTFVTPTPTVYSGSGNIRDPSMVGTETGFFGAWDDNDGRAVQTLVLDDRGVAPGAPAPLTVPMMRDRTSDLRPQLAAAPGQVLLVFRTELNTGERDLFFARFAPDGTPLQAPTEIVIPDEEFWPSPAWGNSRLGIAYVDRQGGDENLWFTSFGCPP